MQRCPTRRRVASNVLIALGLFLLVAAGGMFGYARLRYHQQDEVNSELASYVTVSDAPAEVSEGTGPQVDWAGLEAVNDDVVGWIQIPGTAVNYPVYQGVSNDTYLHTNAYGEYSVGGQIFMDCANAAPGMVDQQTLVYGHHLNNGTMFALVDDMTNQQVFDEHNTVWYVTREESYELEPLYIYRGAAYDASDRQMRFGSDDEFLAFLRERLLRAAAQAPDAARAIARTTRVLTLVTCDYEGGFGQGNGRGMLVCALKSQANPSEETDGIA